MHGIICCLFLLVLTVYGAPQNVYNFEIKSEGKKVILPRDFRFTDCGGTVAHAHSVSVTPDPLHFPGTITLGFNATLSGALVSPLKLGLLIEKEFLGKYIKVPCVDNFGSCTYPDLCDMLKSIDPCPNELQKAGIPCKCPYKAGNYILPSIGIEEGGFPLPSGGYHVQANITANNQLADCYVSTVYGLVLVSPQDRRLYETLEALLSLTLIPCIMFDVLNKRIWCIQRNEVVT